MKAAIDLLFPSDKHMLYQNRLQRWGSLTSEEREIVTQLASERSKQQDAVVSLWEVFDELYPTV